MTDEQKVGPEPTEILSKATAVENIVTWLIASAICRDEQAFGWFMHFAADRIPVDEKTRLLGKIIESLPDPSVVPDGFLDDLRTINQVRVRVAHSLYIEVPASDGAPAGHVMFKKGLPSSVTDEDLRAQVADALLRAQRSMTAFLAIAQASGLMKEQKPDTGTLAFPQRYSRRTRWKATVQGDDIADD